MSISRDLHIGTTGARSVLSFDGASLSVRSAETRRPVLSVPLYHVLWAECSAGTVDLRVLARKKRSSALKLVHVTGPVRAGEGDTAVQWTADLLHVAYRGVRKQRRLKVFVNPVGGKGKAVSIFVKRIEPVLRAAHCAVDVTYTTHRNHAYELARTLPLDAFDALVCVSGDGLVHEVLNGLGHHVSAPLQALALPVAPVPAGSGNALALNLLGLQEGFDVVHASLNVIKGRAVKTDLFSVTQGEQRTLSFLTQAVGLIADLDLGTENLRWMGDGRFVLGYLREVLKHRACPVTVSMKVVESDKDKMAESLRSAYARTAAKDVHTDSDSGSEIGEPLTGAGGALPPLEHTLDGPDAEGWVTFDRPITYFYAGQSPFVSRDLMQFPMSLLGDGVIDIAIMERCTRADMVKAIDGAEKGAPFWMQSLHYYKALAYRVTPTAPAAQGNLSVDGEAFPFAPFAVEVHQALGTLLAPQEAYAPRFELVRPGVAKVHGN